MKKSFWLTGMLLLMSLLTNIGYANDTIRWTWIVNTGEEKHFTLCLGGTGTYRIAWGDGRVSDFPNQSEEDTTIYNTYAVPGSYAVTICSGIPITKLDCSRSWYNSNTGITELDVTKGHNLQSLNCGYNILETLDVSQNTALYYLDCEENRLSALDVAKNPALTELSIGYNALTSLDMSQNLALEKLHCAHNQLTSLDVSKNVNLKDLECSSNQLTLLDVSGNVNLEELDCGYNSLSSVDASKNVNLRVLNCEENGLTSLDVTKNVNLRVLNCEDNRLISLDVTKNVGLEDLSCYFNRLTSLDVSKNENLKTLECGANYLTSLDVSKNAKLYRLNCYSNHLSLLDVSKNEELETLQCSYNRLEFLDLSRNINLERLRCTDNRLVKLEVPHNLTELHSDNNCLTSLNLENYNSGWFSCRDNFREVVLDASSGFDMSTLPGMDVNRILEVKGGVLNGTYLTFSADEVRYKYSTGNRRTSDDTVWFRLVPAEHGEAQIPLTAQCFPDDVFRAYVACFDKNGNDSLCEHERAAVERVEIGGNDFYRGTSSRGVKSLEGLKYFRNLKELYCYSNDLTSLDISKNLKLEDLNCAANALTSLDVSKNLRLEYLECSCNALASLDVSQNLDLRALECYFNALTSLDVSRNKQLNRLSCMFNRIPLSELVDFSNESCLRVCSPQCIPVTLKLGQTLDLNSELVFKGLATEVDFGDISSEDYVFEDGKLAFNKEGTYQLRLTNDTVREREYEYIEGGEYFDGDRVEVFYDITVKADNPSDPSDPSNPDEPGEDPDAPSTPSDTTFNEAALAAAPFAYVQGHTVYLTDGLGAVEAFTAVGQRVYRGHDRAIALPRPGMYILRVVADGRRCKVVVR